MADYPELISARSARKGTTVRGALNSTPSTATTTETFTVQFFAGPSGDGEGKRFLGQKSVTTDESGDATFIFKTKKRVPKVQVMTATATNKATGDTSEFSAGVPVS